MAQTPGRRSRSHPAWLSILMWLGPLEWILIGIIVIAVAFTAVMAIANPT